MAKDIGKTLESFLGESPKTFAATALGAAGSGFVVEAIRNAAPQLQYTDRTLQTIAGALITWWAGKNKHKLVQAAGRGMLYDAASGWLKDAFFTKEIAKMKAQRFGKGNPGGNPGKTVSVPVAEYQRLLGGRSPQGNAMGYSAPPTSAPYMGR